MLKKEKKKKKTEAFEHLKSVLSKTWAEELNSIHLPTADIVNKILVCLKCNNVTERTDRYNSIP